MSEDKALKALPSWSRAGAILGVVTMLILFGFDSGSGAQGIMYAGIKGAISAGLGAGIFGGLAGIVYAPDATTKLVSVLVVVLLSIASLFLAYKYSPKLNSVVEVAVEGEVVTSAANVINPINDNRANPNQIVVIVSPPLRFGTNSIFGITSEEELLVTAKELSDNRPEFEVVLLPVNVGEDELTTVMNRFKAIGVNNVRFANRDDYLEWQEGERIE